jgi:hypothetical protein
MIQKDVRKWGAQLNADTEDGWELNGRDRNNTTNRAERLNAEFEVDMGGDDNSDIFSDWSDPNEDKMKEDVYTATTSKRKRGPGSITEDDTRPEPKTRRVQRGEGLGADDPMIQEDVTREDAHMNDGVDESEEEQGLSVKKLAEGRVKIGTLNVGGLFRDGLGYQYSMDSVKEIMEDRGLGVMILTEVNCPMSRRKSLTAAIKATGLEGVMSAGQKKEGHVIRGY